MQLTKGAIGNLLNRYKSVLRKCHLMNVFGIALIGGMLVFGGAESACADTGGSATSSTPAWNADTAQYINWEAEAIQGKATVSDKTITISSALTLSGTDSTYYPKNYDTSQAHTVNILGKDFLNGSKIEVNADLTLGNGARIIAVNFDGTGSGFTSGGVHPEFNLNSGILKINSEQVTNPNGHVNGFSSVDVDKINIKGGTVHLNAVNTKVNDQQPYLFGPWGVTVSGGTVHMNGGHIETASTLTVSGGTVKMLGMGDTSTKPVIKRPADDYIANFITPKLVISGGTIEVGASGKKGYQGYLFADSSFEMSGSSSITIQGGTLLVTTGNNVLFDQKGGILTIASGGTFELDKGVLHTISGTGKITSEGTIILDEGSTAAEGQTQKNTDGAALNITAGTGHTLGTVNVKKNSLLNIAGTGTEVRATKIETAADGSVINAGKLTIATLTNAGKVKSTGELIVGAKSGDASTVTTLVIKDGSTATNGTIDAKKLTVTSGTTLTVSGTTTIDGGTLIVDQINFGTSTETGLTATGTFTYNSGVVNVLGDTGLSVTGSTSLKTLNIDGSVTANTTTAGINAKAVTQSGTGVLSVESARVSGGTLTGTALFVEDPAATTGAGIHVKSLEQTGGRITVKDTTVSKGTLAPSALNLVADPAQATTDGLNTTTLTQQTDGIVNVTSDAGITVATGTTLTASAINLKKDVQATDTTKGVNARALTESGGLVTADTMTITDATLTATKLIIGGTKPTTGSGVYILQSLSLNGGSATIGSESTPAAPTINTGGYIDVQQGSAYLSDVTPENMKGYIKIAKEQTSRVQSLTLASAGNLVSYATATRDGLVGVSGTLNVTGDINLGAAGEAKADGTITAKTLKSSGAATLSAGTYEIHALEAEVISSGTNKLILTTNTKGELSRNLTVDGGTVTLQKGGTWTLKEGTALTVKSGSLLVEEGTTLDAKNGTLVSSATSGRTQGLSLGENASLYVDFASVFDAESETPSLAGKTGISSRIYNDGTITIYGASGTTSAFIEDKQIRLEDFNTAKDILMTGSGTVEWDGITVSVKGSEKPVEGSTETVVDGTVADGTGVGFNESVGYEASSSNVQVGGGYEAPGILVQNAPTESVKVTLAEGVSGATTLDTPVAEEAKSTDLIRAVDKAGNEVFVSEVEVGSNRTLVMGTADSSTGANLGTDAEGNASDVTLKSGSTLESQGKSESTTWSVGSVTGSGTTDGSKVDAKNSTIRADFITNVGSVAADSGAKVQSTGEISAGGLEAKGTIEGASVEARGDSPVILQGGTITATNGNVSLKSSTDTITDASGTVAATGSTGTVEIKTPVATAKDEPFTVTATQNVDLKTLSAGQGADVTVTAEKGTVTLENLNAAKDAEVTVTAKEGNITTRAVTAKEGAQITVKADAGGVTLDAVTGTDGTVTVSAKDDVVAKGSITDATSVSATDGNITVEGSFSSEVIAADKGDITAKSANGVAQPVSATSISAPQGTVTAADITVSNEGSSASTAPALTAQEVKATSLEVSSSSNTPATVNVSGTVETETVTLSNTAGHIGTLKTDSDVASTISDGSSITAENLELGGDLTIGSDASGDNTSVTVTGTTELNGNDLEILNASATFAELDATEAGGIIYIDPAYVRINSLTGDNLKSGLVVAAGSTVVVGSSLSDTALRSVLSDMGITANTNLTTSGNAILVVAKPFTLDADGVIVVDPEAPMPEYDAANKQYVFGANATFSTDKIAKAGNAYFADNSVLIVDASTLSGTTAAITAGGTDAQAVVGEKAKLKIVNLTSSTGSAKILENFELVDLDGNTVTDGGRIGWIADNTNIITDDRMVTAKAVLDNGDIRLATTLHNASDVLPGLDSELNGTMREVWADSRNDMNSPYGGIRFLSRAASYEWMPDARQGAKAIESVARFAVLGGVPQMSFMANEAAANAVTERTSIANPASSSIQSMASDGTVSGATGDGYRSGFGMWVMPLYQSYNAYGMEGGNMDIDVNGRIGGIALGADYTFSDTFRAGLTFNIGGGYSEGSGDLASTENNMNFWGIGAYLGWAMPVNATDILGATFDINYTETFNDIEQSDTGVGMGKTRSDVNAYALSLGLRGEYRMHLDAVDITPHVGVRYTYLHTDEYDVKAGGTKILKGDAINQDIWSFPVGVTFSKVIALENDWYMRPSLDVQIVPHAGDVKARGDVRFTGVGTKAEMETQMLDYLTYGGQVGVEFGNDTIKLGVNYNLQHGSNSTSHGVFGTFRVEF